MNGACRPAPAGGALSARAAGAIRSRPHPTRGALASLKPVEAMERLLKKLSEFDTNDEFLQSF